MAIIFQRQPSNRGGRNGGAGAARQTKSRPNEITMKVSFWLDFVLMGMFCSSLLVGNFIFLTGIKTRHGKVCAFHRNILAK